MSAAQKQEDHLFDRNGIWQFRRAVPVEFAAIESRAEVTKSMKTDSRSQAEEKATAYWDECVAGWQAKKAGEDQDAKAHFEASERLARSRGFRYITVEELAGGPLAELLSRVEAIGNVNGAPDLTVAAAVLGTVQRPALKLTDALEEFWGFTKSKMRGKREDQIRKWRSPIIRAVNRFVEKVGNLDIHAITRDHLLDFRDYWEHRIEEESAVPGTANKDFIHLGKVIKEVNKRKRLNIPVRDLLDDLSFPEGAQAKRPAFSDGFIREKLLAPGALDGLNGEARAILLTMINTGARPSEIANLQQHRIVLDGDYPHIQIRPDGRQLKSDRAERDIPLTGVSLEAMQAYPNGFERYRSSAATLSATVNKFLRENALVESDRHTMYSLRHALMNRMVTNKVDDRTRRDIMGHNLSGEVYGDGGGVEHRMEVMTPFAI